MKVNIHVHWIIADNNSIDGMEGRGGIDL